MPVVPRNFSSQMVASLCKSVECESLSLFVGSSVGWLCPHCLSLQSMVVWNIIRCLMWATMLYSSHSGSTSPRPYPLTSLPNAEVMIGKVFLYPEATHNQTLPKVTTVNTLAEQDHWCIWFFGAGPYQSLPMLTTLSHAVIGDSGTLETASTKHYQHLPKH